MVVFLMLLDSWIYILEVMGGHARYKQGNQEKGDKNVSCFKRGGPL